MSGFTRDPYWYGGQLVYEAPEAKWRRYHDRHCPGPRERPECTGAWLDHALSAGFRVVKGRHPYFGLVGPGLTEDLDQDAPTTDALWLAVTGKPGAGWVETVRHHHVDLPIGGCTTCGGALRCTEPRAGGWLCASCNRVGAKG